MPTVVSPGSYTGACPIFAFQQITQLETVVPGEWRNIVGLLTTKIFLRASDMDTAMYGEKICGFVQEEVQAVTRTPDSMNLFYDESSRTTTRQLRPRVPADYFLAMPDGDAVIVNDMRTLAWFPAYGMTEAQEITWRQAHPAMCSSPPTTGFHRIDVQRTSARHLPYRFHPPQ